MRWTIFCRVIDNYGDAGVCWRLAADLAQRGESVTLFIDEPDILARLIDTETSPRTVIVEPWPKAEQCFAASDIADVVIEAFACDPPASYITAMAERAATGQPPAWINLEYLSAENWVGAHHGLPSPHPRYPLIKHFYFPGFTPDSGGLIREPGAVEPDQNVAAQVIDTSSSLPLRVLLFCYQQSALQNWLPALSNTLLSAAPGPAAKQITETHAALSPTVHIRHLPFVPQAAFDALLRAHDLLFVRGEDSFVRAQWAGKPVFWHIYPQADGAHLVKLRAFYDRYLAASILDDAQRSAFLCFVFAWNGDAAAGDCGTLWPEIVEMLPALQSNALAWRTTLLKQPDLVTQLQAFVANLVK